MQIQKAEVQDFLADETFQSYCLRNNKRCVAYWENWLAEHPQHTGAFTEAERMYAILSGKQKNVQDNLLALKRRVEYEPVSISTGRYRYWAVAASISLFLFISGSVFFYYHSASQKDSAQYATNITREFHTKAGQKKVLTLTDGTVVHLNSASRLSVLIGFNDTARIVQLTGEAFFEVRHDAKRPFIVKGRRFDVKVLGTRFNVKSYDEDKHSEATLIQGSILVKDVNNDGSLVLLKPRQKIVFHEIKTPHKSPSYVSGDNLKNISIERCITMPDSVIAETAWISERLEICDEPFYELKKELERWFDIDIQLESNRVKNYRFTATFKNENINDVLNSLQKIKHFNYKIYGKEIHITD